MRCQWVPQDSAIYRDYHDEEWGKPAIDPVQIFEKVCLEGFQSGLSWLTILKKRDRFREVFSNFDFYEIAKYQEKDVERLLKDEGIIRHRGKIEAVINNAKKAIELEDADGIVPWFWSFADEYHTSSKPKRPSEVPAVTKQSEAMAKALKKMGWKFVGPTTMYAFMQSEGLVNDHTVGGEWFDSCEKLRSDRVSKAK